jgi:hypothetical protein
MVTIDFESEQRFEPAANMSCIISSPPRCGGCRLLTANPELPSRQTSADDQYKWAHLRLARWPSSSMQAAGSIRRNTLMYGLFLMKLGAVHGET